MYPRDLKALNTSYQGYFEGVTVLEGLGAQIEFREKSWTEPKV